MKLRLRIFKRLTFLLALLSFLAACGYTNRRKDVLLGASTQRSESPQKIFVPVVDNLTTRPGIEATITNALRDTLSTIKGVQIVNSESEAEFLLLASVFSYEKKKGGSYTTGSEATALAKGLAKDESMAMDINVSMQFSVKFLQKIPNPKQADNEILRQVWVRDFAQQATFEAAQLFEEARGASTAPHINESREILQHRIIAENLAKQVIDQVVQDF